MRYLVSDDRDFIFWCENFRFGRHDRHTRKRYFAFWTRGIVNRFIVLDVRQVKPPPKSETPFTDSLRVKTPPRVMDYIQPRFYLGKSDNRHTPKIDEDYSRFTWTRQDNQISLFFSRGLETVSFQEGNPK
jgi:hypothetical protein